MSNDYIYAIEDGQRGFVKIGISSMPEERFRAIKSKFGNHLELVGYAEGTRRHEMELHKLLSKWRVEGEWFRKDGIVLDFLRLMPKSRCRFYGNWKIHELIKRYGAELLAELGECSVRAVSLWCSNHNIPSARRANILRNAESRGIPITPDDLTSD